MKDGYDFKEKGPPDPNTLKKYILALFLQEKEEESVPADVKCQC